MFDNCVKAMHAVVDVMLVDMDSELGGFQLDFAVFDLVPMLEAKTKQNNGDSDAWSNHQQLTNIRVDRLAASGLKLSNRQCEKLKDQFWEAVKWLDRKHSGKSNSEKLEMDNRKAWAEVLSSDFASAFAELRKFVKYYLGFQDSSTVAERCLSLARRVKEAHLGPLLGITLSDLCEIQLDGPKEECELASRHFEDGDERPVLPLSLKLLIFYSIWGAP